MTAIAQTGTTFEDGTYEIAKEANQLHVVRFLSPDPVIQSPGNAQNYNRYSYALNNPLKYTDPSGYMFRGSHQPINPGGYLNHGFKLPQNGTMGSGNHWSDGMMGESYNFLFGSSKKFDATYGVGAHNIAWSIWSNPKARDLWSKGTLTLDMVRETEDVDEAVARVQKQGEYRGTVFFSLTESGHYKYFGYNDSKGNQNIFSPVLKNSQGIIAQILVGEVADFGYYYFSSNLPSFNGEAGGGGNFEDNLNAAGQITAISGSANAVKSQLFNQAAKTSSVPLKNLNYIKGVRYAGIAGSLFGMGVSSYHMYSDYSQYGTVNGWDVADFGVGFASLGATMFLASNPVGWVIVGGASVYFISRAVYDASTND